MRVCAAGIAPERQPRPRACVPATISTGSVLSARHSLRYCGPLFVSALPTDAVARVRRAAYTYKLLLSVPHYQFRESSGRLLVASAAVFFQECFVQSSRIRCTLLMFVFLWKHWFHLHKITPPPHPMGQAGWGPEDTSVFFPVVFNIMIPTSCLNTVCLIGEKTLLFSLSAPQSCRGLTIIQANTRDLREDQTNTDANTP